MQQVAQNGQGQALGQNPYLSQLGDQMTSQMTDGFNRSMPGMNSSVMAAGGYGGSRQGVLQANAMNDMNKQLSSGLSSLYSQGYQADQQYDLGLKNNALGWGNVAGGIRNTQIGADASMANASTAAAAQKYGADLSYKLGMANNELGWGNLNSNYDLGLRNNELGWGNLNSNYDLGLRNNDLGWGNLNSNYDLGLRNNDLGYANLDRNIENDNKGWAMQGANLGLGLMDRANANSQGQFNVGSTIRDQPMNDWNFFNNAANGLGNGFSTGATPQAGNPMMGALGGAQAGQRFGQLWGGSGSGGYSTTGADAYMPAMDTGGPLVF